MKNSRPKPHPPPLQLDLVYQLNYTDVKMLFWLSLSFKGLSTIYKSTVLYWLSVQQTDLGEACTLSCHPEDNHHDVDHDLAAADGDHPNQGHKQEIQGQLGGEKFKSITHKHMYWWCSHCASKTYIYQNTELETLNLSFGRFVMLVYSFSERKKSPTNHYRMRIS